MIFKFKTAYIELGEVVENPQKVIKNYLKKEFIFNVIAQVALGFELYLSYQYKVNPNLRLILVLFFLKTYDMMRIYDEIG